MSAARGFVSALAQLLVNPALRETFYANPHNAADLLGLSDEDRSVLVSLRFDQIERQARLLITKRMRETFLLLPLTVNALGSNSAAYFSRYAAQYWPVSHRRHALDALNFCKFLRQRRLPINQGEYNRARFDCHPKWMCIAFVKDTIINGKARCALQVLYRLGDCRGEWRIYFKI